jgi:hypothetical protein
MRRTPFSLSLALLLLPGTLRGQAVLTGTVRDSTGPLSGVEILIENRNLQTTSDRSGRFFLGHVPYGPQVVLFRRIGLLPVRRASSSPGGTRPGWRCS